MNLIMDASASSPKKALTFHRFPDLPLELRLIIWRYCLPHRIVELDTSIHAIGDPFPCGLTMTSHINGNPPFIARVCRESRAVALRSRSIISEGELPEETQWASVTQIALPIDPSRDLVHLNWEPGSPEFHCRGSSLFYLAWYAARVARGGSLMRRNFQYIEQYEKDALTKLPSWMVVMRTIIIHASHEHAAKTGLFGLLGDAPVQLVDVSDEARVKSFFDLADESQRKGHVIHPQDLHRESAEVVRQKLKHLVDTSYLGDKRPAMHPAIMFRLCTDMCNHSRAAEEGFRPSPEPTPPPPPTRRLRRGQGRVYGRVRGRA